MKELIEKLLSAKKVCVLTGAGISAESGIPTFRGKDGLWNKFNPQELATYEAFVKDPTLVWKWYLWRMAKVAKAQPNKGHLAIKEMEELFPEFLLITQNVDGLHQRAGSKKLVELHGNIFKGKCRFCGKEYSQEEFSRIYPFASLEFLKEISEEELKEKVFKEVERGELPKCKVCGEIVGPGVVWFGEALPQRALEKAVQFASECDVFFSVGTSAVVYPAASLPLTAKERGALLVEVNPEETPISRYCDYSLRQKASQVLPSLLKELRKSRGKSGASQGGKT
ncbi:SIR2 family NAD-dependent protein deacylase [Thermovibrio sp.]